LKRLSRYRLVLSLLALLVAGCSIPSEAPIGEITDMREYFWTSSEATLHYDVYTESQSTPTMHSVVVRTGAGDLIAHDNANSQSGIIIARADVNEIILKEIISSDLFPLPPGAYITREGTSEIKDFFGVTGFHSSGQNQIAFTDNGVFTDQGSGWTPRGVLTNAAVTVVAQNPAVPNEFFAGTATGEILHSTNFGATWISRRNAADGPIKGFAFADSAVYAAVRNLGVIVSDKRAPFVEMGATKIPGNITGIAIVRMSSKRGDYEVLASTDTFGLLYTSPSGSYWAARGQLGLTSNSFQGLYGHQDNTFLLVGDGVTFFTSQDTSREWKTHNLTSMSTGEQITHVFRDDDNTALIGTSIGAIYEFSFLRDEVLPIANVGMPINGLMRNGSRVMVSTATGLHEVQGPVSFSNVGPFELTADTTKGEFVLLQTNGAPLQVGDNWLAGHLFLPEIPLPTKSVPITARVIERIDTLKALGEAYPDVLAVRYAFEPVANTPIENAPYWMIYYSRGLGPVMIDQVLEQAGVRSNRSRALLRRN
jgi:hypothetical protein